MTTRTQDPAPEATPGESPQESQPAGKLKSRPLTFRTPPESPAPSPSPEAATDDGSAAGEDFPGPSDEPRASRPRKSGGSRTSSPVDSPEHVQKAIHAGVISGTEAAHELLVHDPVAQDVELLIADDDDAQGISEPGARLVARRLTSGINNPDLADGIELAIAVGAYVAKQLRKLRAIRAARRAEAETLEQLAAEAGEQA